jgi:DNA polymerase/3'-5' exonuclease PolX
MYNTTREFIKDLVSTYETILDICKISGDNGIANKKRQETFKKAVGFVMETNSNLSLLDFVKELESILTEKPIKIMKELLTNGMVVLEKKTPYNGTIIKNGKIIDGYVDIDIEAFKNLSILTGIGIGLGDIGVKELTKMGFKTIDNLKEMYENDKFVTLRKGLQGPLCKYFEGTVRIQKMSRIEATKWRDTIQEIINNAIVDNYENITVKHKIGGSYARKQEEIGDIDYIVVVNDSQNNANKYLYKLMNNILDQLTEITNIGDLPVELDSVSETPSKPIGSKRSSTTVKLWFKVGILKTKVEIYGYSNCEFIFPYFARSADVNLQKKIKIHANKRGYKLSPWGLDKKDTDEPITDDLEQVELIRKKIGKDNIETLKELFNFLEFK